MVDEVEIEKLVHGGQGLGAMPDGRKIFVWGALPGEKVRARVIKSKKSYVEAISETILQPSPLRVLPRESNYLSTSPWQILAFSAENNYKKRIVQELFAQAHIPLPDFEVIAAGNDWRYRNKMEYSFWGDAAGLHLALYTRGSHQKVVVDGSELAMTAVDIAARKVLAELQKHAVRAGDLKTIIVRCNQKGQAVVSLFVKPTVFPEFALPQGLQGLRVYHSNPKSPASVTTTLLQEAGDPLLHDTLLGRQFTYDADSFFQVNVPVFEAALEQIRSYCVDADRLTDMYAGAGSIGLSVAREAVDLIELDPATAAMARLNAQAAPVKAHVIEASSEKALEYISSESPILFDPPRAGLHDKVTRRTLEVRPPQMIYLSCNPATQARDIAILQEAYDIIHFAAFNFFPHTPHIETLAVMQRKRL